MAELMQSKYTITLAALVYCLQMSLKILSWTVQIIFFNLELDFGVLFPSLPLTCCITLQIV